MLSRGRDLDVITSVDVIERREALGERVSAFSHACHLAEVTGRLVPEGQDVPEVYQLLERGVDRARAPGRAMGPGSVVRDGVAGRDRAIASNSIDAQAVATIYRRSRTCLAFKLAGYFVRIAGRMTRTAE